MTKELVLVRFDDNYADEFDMNGFKAMALDDWQKLETEVEKSMKDGLRVEVFFGSNEEFIYNSYSDWRSTFEITPLTEDEYKFLEKTFNLEFGETSAFDILEFINEE